MMKYKVELKKTHRMGHVYGSIYLAWLKDGVSHVTTTFEEAAEYNEEDLKEIQERFGDRIILHTKEKGSKEWKK